MPLLSRKERAAERKAEIKLQAERASGQTAGPNQETSVWRLAEKKRVSRRERDFRQLLTEDLNYNEDDEEAVDSDEERDKAKDDPDALAYHSFETSDALAYYRLALSKEDYPLAAVDAYTKAIAFAPKEALEDYEGHNRKRFFCWEYFFNAYNNRAVAKHKLGDVYGQIEDLNKAIDILRGREPWIYEFSAIDCYFIYKTYYQRGHAYLKLGHPFYDDAIGDFTNSMKSLALLEAAEDVRTTFYEWKEASRDDACPDYSTVGNLYVCRGDAKANKGDSQGAVKDYFMAIKYNAARFWCEEEYSLNDVYQKYVKHYFGNDIYPRIQAFLV